MTMNDRKPDGVDQWPLEDAIGWAILGYHASDQPDKHPTTVYDFLDELYSKDPYVAGEPGWTIERIDLVEDFEKSQTYLDGQLLEDLKELQRRGEKEGFWVANMDVDSSLRTYSSEVFWCAARKSLLAYGRDNPKRQSEIEEAFRRYPQLRSLPHPPFSA